MATREKNRPMFLRCPFCGKSFKGTHTKNDCRARLGNSKNHKIKSESRKRNDV